MAVGEVFLAAFLQVLFDRLASREFLKFARQKGIGGKLEKWSETLSAIRAVLYDAEEKQLISMSVKEWLDDLKDLAYDVEDILDRFSTDMLRFKAKEQNLAGTSKVRGLFLKVKCNFNMNSEMEKISERLQEISQRKNMLGLNNSGAGSSAASQRRTSSCLLDGPVVGRYEDKRKIVALLSRDEPSTVNFHVVAIVGMPGVGKTTLAKSVFKDNNIALEQFDLKVWVSVSDDFDLVRVTKAILESVTSVYCDFKEFNKVQDNLSKELASKKFLIVLDDVWNTCDHDQWTTLQSPFHVGAPGSKIIVTTRDEKVARMTRPIEIHCLKYMSDDDCWEVFQQHAFMNVNSGRPQGFEFFESIVRKCGGLPLAARTLGGLLGCEDIDEWKKILNNRLWSLSNKSHIHQVLKLSYHYLPSYLKRCFAYCSILPNDYEFGEKQLTLLWMAEGLLQQQEEHETLEDLGGHYFGQLLSRSLFQKSSRNSSLYVMHHLVGDLARWAAGEICLRLEDKDGRCSRKTRHSSYIPGQYDGVNKFEAFSEARRLRTFLPLSEDFCNHVTCKVTLDLLPRLEYLRVLSLNGYQITELPNSIGNLKHLRYLDVSHTLIMRLPESTSTLCNLQTLILESCSRLKTLPTKMRYLSNLRHLNNLNVPSLEGMPPQLSQLSNLQTLPNFVVGKGSDSRVREIGPLSLLRGTLCLSRLENVNDVEDARRSDLICKEGIDALQLEWNDKGENESIVLDMLKPHKKMKEVIIKGYGGLQFSAWIGDPLFSYVVQVRLENCNNCRFLPPLGQLPSLQILCIRNMSGVEKVGLEFCGEGSLSFPLLETLVFEDMQNWNEWFPCQGYQGLEVFPSLKILSVKRCPKLKGELPHKLDLLTKLEIHECNELVVSIANYKQLCELNVRDCKGVVYKSVHHFELLKSIYLSDFSVLRFQTGGFMTGLRKVEQLMIANGDELSSEWQNEGRLLQHLISLRSLFIERNSHLLQLHCLTSLQMLHIYRCPSLVSIPESCLPASLKDIEIERCGSLTCFARYKIPPSLRTIEIKHCQCLKYLVEEEQVEGCSSASSSLEYLSISNCPSLISLSSRGGLPKALKHLYIRDCEQLETISEGFYDDTCLEELHIGRCANLKFLPEGLCLLANLRRLIVFVCGSLVSFPRGGLPTRPSNLTFLVISDCQRWKAFPKGMINLNSLQELVIGSCEGLASILEEGFPPNLTSLILLNPSNCKPLTDWGLHLHRLTSLTELCIQGVDQDLVSFPPEEMLLPTSLIKLTIGFFPNLRRISSQGLQVLTSLESLRIDDCPKLASMPEDLPSSLTQLYIYDDCPLLRKRYKPDITRYWAKISHIPYIEIGDYKP